MSIRATRINDLPRDVLGQIFSYLDLRSLGRTARVCRDWREAQRIDWIWQTLCRSTLDLPTTPQGGWRWECRVLHRWRTMDAEEMRFTHTTEFIMDRRRLPFPASVRCNFVTLGDNGAFEVTLPDSARPLLYLVRDLTNQTENKLVNLEQYGCEGVAASALCEKVWTILDAKGNLFQFDIETGVCLLNGLAGLSPQGGLTCVHSNDHEIIVVDTNRVQIWDLQKCEYVQAFELPLKPAIGAITSTQNYVFCFAMDMETKFCSLFAINKKDPSSKISIFGDEYSSLPQFFRCVAYGSFCSVLIPGEEVWVYEDRPDGQLLKARTISLQDPHRNWSFAGIQMYHNWVCVRNWDRFRVFDVRTGTEINTVRCLPMLSNFDIEVQLNAQMMLVRWDDDFPAIMRREGAQRKIYSLYDFSKPVRQPSSGWCSVM
jgi:hypothetical protein